MPQQCRFTSILSITQIVIANRFAEALCDGVKVTKNSWPSNKPSNPNSQDRRRSALRSGSHSPRLGGVLSLSENSATESMFAQSRLRPPRPGRSRRHRSTAQEVAQPEGLGQREVLSQPSCDMCTRTRVRGPSYSCLS